MDEPKLDFAQALAAASGADGEGEAHLTPEVLVAYRLDRLDAGQDDAVQEHLARCRACSDLLLELAEFSRGGADEVDDEAPWNRFADRLRAEAAAPAPPPPGPPRRRRTAPPARWATALAAGFLASTVGLGIWVAVQHQQLAALRRPRVNVPIVNLVPAGYTRGDAPPATVGAGRAVVLILNPPGFPTAGAYRVELLAVDGRRLWAGAGLTPTAAGNFYLELPPELLRVGEIRIRLLRGDDEVAEFPLQINP
jgi:hypothetical protein